MEGTSTRPAAPARHSVSVGLSADAAQAIGEQIVRRLDQIGGVLIHGSAFEDASRAIADEVQQVVALQLSRATPTPESIATTLADSRALLLPDDVAAITKAVQQRLVRIAFADVVQVAQARLELTELEARCRRLEIELRFANENRLVLAAEACCDAGSLTLDDSGPSYAELSELSEQPEPGNGGGL